MLLSKKLKLIRMSMIFESFDWNIQGCCHLYQILIYETCKQCFQSLCATSDNLFYIVVCTFSFGHCIYQIVHGTKGHMAVYGPGCHPQNIIWTEAKPQNIIWPKRSWGPYTILWVTDRYINCHMARSAMNYLLYYTQYL